MNSLAVEAVEARAREERVRLAMWVLIAGEILFFGALCFAYGLARWHLPQGFAVASAHTRLALGTLNTAVLLTSSFAMAMAAHVARERGARASARWLWAVAAMGLLFVALKGYEWQGEWREGLVPGPGFSLAEPGAQLFFAWYFTATALHAVHLLIGVGVCVLFAHAARRQGEEPVPRVDATRLDALALYWHFVDAVWIFLYPLIYLVAPR